MKTLRICQILIVCLAAAPALSACSPGGIAVGAGAGTAVAAQKEKGLGQVVSDTAISAQINFLWLQHSKTVFLNAEAEAQEGRVLVHGIVPKPEDRLDAIRLAWQADGVKEVINELEVGDTSSLSDYALDVWIGTQLKTALLFDREISAIDFTVDTVNQTVYLMGIARTQNELERVIAHAKNIRYARHVVSYVRLKSESPEAS